MVIPKLDKQGPGSISDVSQSTRPASIGWGPSQKQRVGKCPRPARRVRKKKPPSQTQSGESENVGKKTTLTGTAWHLEGWMGGFMDGWMGSTRGICGLLTASLSPSQGAPAPSSATLQLRVQGTVSWPPQERSHELSITRYPRKRRSAQARQPKCQQCAHQSAIQSLHPLGPGHRTTGGTQDEGTASRRASGGASPLNP